MPCAKVVFQEEFHNSLSPSSKAPVWDDNTYRWQVVRISKNADPKSYLLVELEHPFDKVRYFKPPEGGFHFELASEAAENVSRQTNDNDATIPGSYMNEVVIPTAKEHLKRVIARKYSEYDSQLAKSGEDEVVVRERLMRKKLKDDWGWEWNNSAVSPDLAKN